MEYGPGFRILPLPWVCFCSALSVCVGGVHVFLSLYHRHVFQLSIVFSSLLTAVSIICIGSTPLPPLTLHSSLLCTPSINTWPNGRMQRESRLCYCCCCCCCCCCLPLICGCLCGCVRGGLCRQGYKLFLPEKLLLWCHVSLTRYPLQLN